MGARVYELIEIEIEISRPSSHASSVEEEHGEEQKETPHSEERRVYQHDARARVQQHEPRNVQGARATHADRDDAQSVRTECRVNTLH